MRLLAFFVALLSPVMAFAHQGHDHSHWTSALVHAVLFISLCAIGYMVYALVQNKAGNSAKAELQEDKTNA